MPRNHMSRRIKKTLEKDGMAMLKTGMECGTAAFVVHEGIKAYSKHEEMKYKPNQMQMPNQNQWSNSPFGSRSISPSPAPVLSTLFSNGSTSGSARGYVHQSFCNGSCGGQCAGVGGRDAKAIEYPQEGAGGVVPPSYHDATQRF